MTYIVNEQNVEIDDVPVDPISCLSYYLYCISFVLDSNRIIISDDLISYQKAGRLSDSKAEELIRSALLFSPKEVVSKIVIVDNTEHSLLPKGHWNWFYDRSEVTNAITIPSQTVVGGRQIHVSKALFCSMEWVENYFIAPMKRIQAQVARATSTTLDQTSKTLHDMEAVLQQLIKQTGMDGIMSSTIDLMTTQHCLHCNGTGARCTCRKSCPRNAMSGCCDDHPDTTCDRCGRHGLRGSRYQCQACQDFNLCEECYWIQRDSHLQCRFWRIDRNTQGNTKPLFALNPRKPITPPTTTTTNPSTAKPETSSTAGHPNVTCRGCKQSGFRGCHYKCRECLQYDLCQTCYRAKNDTHLQCRFWCFSEDGVKVAMPPRGLQEEAPASLPHGSPNIAPTPIPTNTNYSRIDPLATPISVPPENQMPSKEPFIDHFMTPIATAVPISETGSVPASNSFSSVTSKFTPGETVQLVGLADSHLNGISGAIERSIPPGDKYVVNLPNHSTKVFHAKNLRGIVAFDSICPLDTCVQLKGLTSNPKENGKYGIVVGHANGRVAVKLLDENRVLRLKKENLTIIDEAA